MLWLAITAGALVVLVTSLVLFSAAAAGMADRSVRVAPPDPRPMGRPSFAPAAEPFAFCGDCRNVYETTDPDPLPPCPSCNGALTRAARGAPVAAAPARDAGADTWY